MVKIFSLLIGIGLMGVAIFLTPGPDITDIAWVPLSMFFLSKGMETQAPPVSYYPRNWR